MGKLVSCRSCGAEIAKSAKTCPQCGAKNKNPFYKRWWFWVLVVIVLLSGVGSNHNTSSQPVDSAQSNAAQPVADPGESSTAQTEPKQEFVIPETVVYSGTGDSVLEIEPFDGAYVFHIKGNSASRHFAVTAYDSGWNYLDLLVNTTDVYDGLTLDPTLTASFLEISATGDWTVELVSAYNIETMSAGETLSGNGDSVFMVLDEMKLAKISGNAAGRYFGVKALGTNSNDLLVNTTDPYEGTVMVKNSPVFIVVTAVGDWSIGMS